MVVEWKYVSWIYGSIVRNRVVFIPFGFSVSIAPRPTHIKLNSWVGLRRDFFLPSSIFLNSWIIVLVLTFNLKNHCAHFWLPPVDATERAINHSQEKWAQLNSEVMGGRRSVVIGLSGRFSHLLARKLCRRRGPENTPLRGSFQNLTYGPKSKNHYYKYIVRRVQRWKFPILNWKGYYGWCIN